MSKRIPTLVVIDYKAGSVTIDGAEMLPGHYIADDPKIEVGDGGYISRVDFGIYADNVVVRTSSGSTSPTAAVEAKRIVREGLKDVLAWLGEEQA